MLCFTAVGIVVLYIYSSYQSSAITYSYSDLEKTAVYIYPNSGFDYESFNQRLSDESLNASSAAYVFNGKFEDFKIENDALAQRISTHTELLCYPFDESENSSENTSLYSGENFSSSQLENGDDVCIICGAQYSDKVTVGGNELHRYRLIRLERQHSLRISPLFERREK